MGREIDWDVVDAILKKYAANRVSAWTQDRLRVEGGFCAGMCLDWVRRILRQGFHTVEPNGARSAFASLNDLKVMRQQCDLDREAKALKQKAITTRVKPEQVLFPYLQSLGINANSVEDITKLPHDQAVRAGQLAKLLGFEFQTDPQKAAVQLSHLVLPQAYTDFAVKKKEFSEIGQGHISPAKIDSSAVGLFLDEQDRPLVPGTWIWEQAVEPNLKHMPGGWAAILSCGKLGAKGHDLGFYALVDHRLYTFMDPNFGEFTFDTQEDLGLFFRLLWDEVYAMRDYNWAQWATYYGKGNVMSV